MQGTRLQKEAIPKTEMCSGVSGISPVEATPKVVSAEGIPARKWFAAVVKRNTEKACRDRLAELGYESYVASQKEMRVWRSGQKKQIERIVISTLIFVHATEKERLQTLKLPFIFRYLTDKALRADDLGRHPIATIPDHQMQTLRFMLYNAESPVNFWASPLHLGDRIRVVRGSLKGLEGNVTRLDGNSYLVVNVDFLGSAMVNISSDDIEKIA